MEKFKNTYIKSAFVGFKGEKGAKASVNLVDDIDSKESINSMQNYTKELNLPISCFIKKTKEKNKFFIRYFIKDNEEPICGHGTIVATKFLLENNIINSNRVEFIPLLTKDRIIVAEINNDDISIFIKTIKPKEIDINSTIGKKIIDSISSETNIPNIKKIVEGNLDYTVEIEKNSNSLSNSCDTIKSIEPNFDKIEKIELSSGKLCRGIDVVIKNEEKKEEVEPDYITRIFLPLGADERYKEDPACGSGTSYVMRYLTETYKELNEKELKIYQASKDGAFLKVRKENNDTMKITGNVK